MTQKASTRRTFLKGGALFAAPLAAASVSALALADDGLKGRVRRLEDEAAIRELHQSWLRQVNAGEGTLLSDDSVRRITADHAGTSDRIEIAADGRSAVGHFDCALELERPLDRDSTLAQMAHVQGSGRVRSLERRVLNIAYTKMNGIWSVRKVEVETLSA